MTKIDRRRRKSNTRRHVRRDARRAAGPTYDTTVRALKRVANKNNESIADVLGALRIRAILGNAI